MPIALLFIHLICADYKNTTVRQAIIFINLSLELFQLCTLLYYLGSHLGHLISLAKPIDNLRVALAYFSVMYFLLFMLNVPLITYV